jgi:hypothetical protein
MDVIGVGAGIIAVSNEIDLEFGFAAFHVCAAKRAESPDAAPSPCPVGTAIRQPPGG